MIVRIPGDKPQPAVVIRSDLLADLTYATMLPVTTDLREDVPDLRIDVPAGAETGLKEPSQVMVDWPQTVRLERTGEVIGQIDAASMRKITRQVAFVLGVGTGSRRRSAPA